MWIRDKYCRTLSLEKTDSLQLDQIWTAIVESFCIFEDLKPSCRREVRINKKMIQFSCQSWCNSEPEEEIIDWSSSSENIVEGTLRREHLLMKLQELEDSESSQTAESALQAMNEAVSEDDALYLKWMERAGTLSIIQEVLQREQDRRPSPLAAAPLLHKFAKHQIGRSAPSQPHRSTTATSGHSRLVTYLLRRT